MTVRQLANRTGFKPQPTCQSPKVLTEFERRIGCCLMKISINCLMKISINFYQMRPSASWRRGANAIKLSLQLMHVIANEVKQSFNYQQIASLVP